MAPEVYGQDSPQQDFHDESTYDTHPPCMAVPIQMNWAFPAASLAPDGILV